MSMARARKPWWQSISSVESLALLYVALPNVLFLQGWIVSPWSWLGAGVVTLCVLWTIRRTDVGPAPLPLGRRWWFIFAVATFWCLDGGIGHFVYANIDWFVRDAVLVDLVRNPWPVRYRLGAEDMLMRSATGFYLLPALVGKLTSIRVADLALLVWTVIGVVITLALVLRDQPPWRVCVIRLVVFILFSGMDILPTVVRHYPYNVGEFIEWWGRYISFQSQSTSLFWAPNHTIPVWIATAWLASQPFRAISIERASLFVVLIPLSSPIAGLGVALFVIGLIVHRFATERLMTVVRELIDWRLLATAAVCLGLVYPYLLSGSGEIHSGFFWDLPWVGEDFVQRYLEFVLVEFLGVAVVLLMVRPRDPLLWLATAALLALPIYRFGPFNDLAMRGSITGLEVLAIRLGQWMGTWVEAPVGAEPRWRLRAAAVVLFSIGAVTPFMEMSRPLVRPAWSMDMQKSIVDASHGASHYLTPDRGPWLQRFLKPGPRTPHTDAQ